MNNRVLGSCSSILRANGADGAGGDVLFYKIIFWMCLNIVYLVHRVSQCIRIIF